MSCCGDAAPCLLGKEHNLLTCGVSEFGAQAQCALPRKNPKLPSQQAIFFRLTQKRSD